MADGVVEIWRDEHGTEWELADFGDGSIIRERNILDLIDGDAREGYAVIARFLDVEDAQAFMRQEGFESVGLEDD